MDVAPTPMSMAINMWVSSSRVLKADRGLISILVATSMRGASGEMTGLAKERLHLPMVINMLGSFWKTASTDRERSLGRMGANMKADGRTA